MLEVRLYGEVCFPQGPSSVEPVAVYTCSPGDLSGCLSSTQAVFAEAVAPWDALSVEVSRLLAEWAMRDAARGFSVVPSDCLNTGRVPQAAGTAGRAFAVDVINGNTRVRYSHQDRSTPPANPEEVNAPVATSFTEHGAEHCVRVGQKWLCSHPSIAPGPDVLGIDAVQSDLIFLNACSSLRLGDSCVPRRYSLAAQFHSRGTTVIGAFRNVRPTKDLDRLFASAVLENEPAGRIANRLNRELDLQQGGGAAYTMLGSALARPMPLLPGGISSPQPSCDALSAELPLPKSVALLWWERLSWMLERCGVVSDETVAARARNLELARLIRMISKPECRGATSSDELRLIEAEAGRCAGDLRRAIFDDLQDRVGRGEWLVAAVSPYSPPPAIDRRQCPCGSALLTMSYDVLGEGSHILLREECDRCGTLSDSFGNAPPHRRLQVRLEADTASLEVPALEPGAYGLLLVHRNPQIQSRCWGKSGTVKIPLKNITGRATIVALVGGGDYLQANYATIFSEPRNGRALER